VTMLATGNMHTKRPAPSYRNVAIFSNTTAGPN
jgi:hypothetical protein